MTKVNLTPTQSLSILEAVNNLKHYGVPQIMKHLREMKESYARDHIHGDNNRNIDVSLAYESLCTFLEQIEAIEKPEVG